MQQDAMQRVREMQRRARERLEASNRIASGLPAAQAAQEAPQNTSPAQRPAAQQKARQLDAPQQKGAFPFQGILEKLGMDGETGLILLLLLLLINEGADRTVILALVYILVA